MAFIRIDLPRINASSRGSAVALPHAGGGSRPYVERGFSGASSVFVEEPKRTGELEAEAVNTACVRRKVRGLSVQVPPARSAAWSPDMVTANGAKYLKRVGSHGIHCSNGVSMLPTPIALYPGTSRPFI
jgi:hypothetical protein